MALDADDRVRLDYEQTTQYLRTLIDVRFRLLAFVPTVTGVAVAVIGRPRPASELLGVGVIGLLATLGIFVYELRNTQISGTLIRRAAELERQLQLPSSLGTHHFGGLYTERPGVNLQLLGFLTTEVVPLHLRLEHTIPSLMAMVTHTGAPVSQEILPMRHMLLVPQ